MTPVTRTFPFTDQQQSVAPSLGSLLNCHISLLHHDDPPTTFFFSAAESETGGCGEGVIKCLFAEKVKYALVLVSERVF